MNPVEISKDHARAITLTAQGLRGSKPFGEGKSGALKAIQHLGYVQIDTISVVERAHHHVLWSRVPGFQPSFLHELQCTDQEIFEYWSHAASYLPICDFRFSLPRMKAYAEKDRHWFRRNRKVMAYVLDRIQNEGPLRATDFEASPRKKSGPWFEWKPAKKALEQLFMEGKLMIRERRGFQKVYDLAERVLPKHVDRKPPAPDEFARHLIERSLRSHGIATEAEICYLRRGIRRPVSRMLKQLEDEGQVRPLRVKSLEPEIYYCRPEALETPAPAPSSVDEAHLLSPFDNLVIQRRRIRNLFDFDYQIECYLPAPKRKYGYFSLPVLWNDRLVGRIDAKADRPARTLEVKSVHLEIRGAAERRSREPIHRTLERFATFNGCDQVRMK